MIFIKDLRKRLLNVDFQNQARMFYWNGKN